MTMMIFGPLWGQPVTSERFQYRLMASTGLRLDRVAIATKLQQMSCDVIHHRFPASLSSENHRRQPEQRSRSCLGRGAWDQWKTGKCPFQLFFLVRLIRWRHTYEDPGYGVGPPVTWLDPIQILFFRHVKSKSLAVPKVWSHSFHLFTSY